MRRCQRPAGAGSKPALRRAGASPQVCGIEELRQHLGRHLRSGRQRRRLQVAAPLPGGMRVWGRVCSRSAGKHCRAVMSDGERAAGAVQRRAARRRRGGRSSLCTRCRPSAGSSTIIVGLARKRSSRRRRLPARNSKPAGGACRCTQARAAVTTGSTHTAAGRALAGPAAQWPRLPHAPGGRGRGACGRQRQRPRQLQRGQQREQQARQRAHRLQLRRQPRARRLCLRGGGRRSLGDHARGVLGSAAPALVPTCSLARKGAGAALGRGQCLRGCTALARPGRSQGEAMQCLGRVAQ